jgi:hypothetical protein
VREVMAQLRRSRKSVRPGCDYPPASNGERAGLRHPLAYHMCVGSVIVWASRARVTAAVDGGAGK